MKECKTSKTNRPVVPSRCPCGQKTAFREKEELLEKGYREVVPGGFIKIPSK
ncbi:MAG: hypothetical protein R6V40_00615 [Candidatus Moraniibacteriota bacterium]